MLPSLELKLYSLLGIPHQRLRCLPHVRMNFDEITLDQSALRYLESKGRGTKIAYEKCLRRFAKFYGKPLTEYVTEIEG